MSKLAKLRTSLSARLPETMPSARASAMLDQLVQMLAMVRGPLHPGPPHPRARLHAPRAVRHVPHATRHLTLRATRRNPGRPPPRRGERGLRADVAASRCELGRSTAGRVCKQEQLLLGREGSLASAGLGAVNAAREASLQPIGQEPPAPHPRLVAHRRIHTSCAGPRGSGFSLVSLSPLPDTPHALGTPSFVACTSCARFRLRHLLDNKHRIRRWFRVRAVPPRTF